MGGGGMQSMLGKMIFQDTNLSQPTGLACVSCHNSTGGFADPRPTGLPTSVGSVPQHMGGRNAPTAAYASYSPTFSYDAVKGQYVGGQFWDGRAATLADQAKGPFLNPLEHAMPDKAAVVTAVKSSMYGNMFTMTYGSNNTVDQDYNNIAGAIATWEASSDVTQFTSRYDRYLAGTDTLTDPQARGMQKFQLHCTSCHSMAPNSGKEVFTDFTYHNAGTPRNPKNPFYSLPAEFNPAGANWMDLGLGGSLGLASEDGKFKTPTMRNVAVTGPWGHNGYFESLEEMVDFMANRDLEPGVWPAPEVPANLDMGLGNFNFSAQDVADVTAFLGTLTDAGMTPEPATVVMLAAGAGVLACRRRRRGRDY
jgi:cytochrome c peroxidase